MESRPAEQQPTEDADADLPSDGFLVERTLAGDRSQFDELIRRYHFACWAIRKIRWK